MLIQSYCTQTKKFRSECFKMVLLRVKQMNWVWWCTSTGFRVTWYWDMHSSTPVPHPRLCRQPQSGKTTSNYVIFMTDWIQWKGCIIGLKPVASLLHQARKVAYNELSQQVHWRLCAFQSGHPTDLLGREVSLLRAELCLLARRLRARRGHLQEHRRRRQRGRDVGLGWRQVCSCDAQRGEDLVSKVLWSALRQVELWLASQEITSSRLRSSKDSSNVNLDDGKEEFVQAQNVQQEEEIFDRESEAKEDDKHLPNQVRLRCLPETEVSSRAFSANSWVKSSFKHLGVFGIYNGKSYLLLKKNSAVLILIVNWLNM